jgi:hypothetical protein
MDALLTGTKPQPRPGVTAGSNIGQDTQQHSEVRRLVSRRRLWYAATTHDRSASQGSSRPGKAERQRTTVPNKEVRSCMICG